MWHKSDRFSEMHPQLALILKLTRALSHENKTIRQKAQQSSFSFKKSSNASLSSLPSFYSPSLAPSSALSEAVSAKPMNIDTPDTLLATNSCKRCAGLPSHEQCTMVVFVKERHDLLDLQDHISICAPPSDQLSGFVCVSFYLGFTVVINQNV